MNIYKALPSSHEPLGIFYAFATWKGKSPLNIVTDYVIQKAFLSTV